MATENERRAFSAQIEIARIEPVDAEHDRFELPDEIQAFGPWIPGRTVDAIYYDLDGVRVNIIVHIIGGKLSWAERYRDLGDSIVMWPPGEDTTLQFLRYDSSGAPEFTGSG